MRNLKLWSHSFAILFLAFMMRILKMALESPGIEEIFASLVALRPLTAYGSSQQIDFCPPLYYAILHPIALQNSQLLVFRFVSIAFGCLTCVVLYHVGRKLFDHKTGALAGYLLAINPLHIFFSQEAQSVALFTLLSVVALAFLVRTTDRMRASRWIAYDISALLMLHSQREAQFVLAIFLLLHVVYAIFFSERDEQERSQRGAYIRTIFFNYLIIVAVSVPWLFTMQNRVPWFVPPPDWRDLVSAVIKAPLFGMVSQDLWVLAGAVVLLIALVPPLIRVLQDIDFKSLAVTLVACLGIVLPYAYSFVETPRFLPYREAATVIPFTVLVVALLIAKCNLYVRTVLVILFGILFIRMTWRQAAETHKTSLYKARDVIEQNAPEHSLLVFWPDFTTPMGEYFFGDKYEITGASDFFKKWAELPDNSNVYFVIGQYPGKTAHLYTFGGALSQYSKARVLWQEKLNRVVEAKNLNRVNLGLWYGEPRTLNIVDTPSSDTQFLFTAEKPEFRNEKFFHVDRPDVNYDSRGRRVAWTKTEHVELRLKVTLAPGNYVLKLHCTPILEQPALGKVHQRSVVLEMRTGVESKRVQLEGEHTLRLPLPTETEVNELPVNIDISKALNVSDPIPSKYGIGIYSIGIDMVAEEQ